MKLEEEYVQPCYVCGKIWQRKDAKKWHYFHDILVCRHHPGVQEWYRGALKMSEELLKLSIEP